MDQKASLTDSTLKMYPSQKLINFIQTLKTNYDIPENIVRFMKSQPGKEKETVKLKKTEQVHHLSDADMSNLDKIKAALKKLEPEKEVNMASDSETTTKSDKVCEDLHKADGGGDRKKELDLDSTQEKITTNYEMKKREGPFLRTSDLDWLYVYLNNIRALEKDTPYLHELMEGIRIEMPENSIIERNPALEERCVKLRAQQEARDYRKMTKGVDNVRIRFPDDSISFQLKQMNRQLIAIGQFIISIFAGFLFGFRGVEWMVGNLDFGFRLLLGVMCALVIALAEIYFLAKKLNEELNIPETTQLGGPPKFVDEQKYGSHKKVKGVDDKEHQD